eukprot:SAG22_NODE_10930_length_509_cov_1.009756_1_plen_71_part_10
MMPRTQMYLVLEYEKLAEHHSSCPMTWVDMVMGKLRMDGLAGYGSGSETDTDADADTGTGSASAAGGGYAN